MAEYVKFAVPKELSERQLLVLEKVKKTGKLKIGSNEVTKSVERGEAKLVFIASDVNPAEVVIHLPIICKEKNIPFSYVATKKELGEKSGIEVGTTAVAVVKEGEAKKDIEDLAKKISSLEK